MDATTWISSSATLVAAVITSAAALLGAAWAVAGIGRHSRRAAILADRQVLEGLPPESRLHDSLEKSLNQMTSDYVARVATQSQRRRAWAELWLGIYALLAGTMFVILPADRDTHDQVQAWLLMAAGIGGCAVGLPKVRRIRIRTDQLSADLLHPRSQPGGPPDTSVPES